jgi:hypothetical protein
MPGKRWTRTEKQLLKEQIAAGIPGHNIVIESDHCLDIHSLSLD